MSGWGEFYGNGNQSLQSEVFIQMVQILADTKYLIQNREESSLISLYSKREFHCCF